MSINSTNNQNLTDEIPEYVRFRTKAIINKLNALPAGEKPPITTTMRRLFSFIFIPNVNFEHLNIDHFKKHGIGKIISIKIDDGKYVESEYKLAETGKVVRLINPYPLNQEDFYTMMLHSHPLVGCTGDHSLSEVLSFDRLPFYEIRPFKVDLWKDMVELAAKVGGQTHLLQKYFSIIAEIYSEDQEVLIKYFTLTKLFPKIPTVMPTNFFMNCVRAVGQYFKLWPSSFTFPKDELDRFTSAQPKLAEIGVRLAEILQDKALFTEMSEFSALIKKHYNYSLVLKDIIPQKLAYAHFSGLQWSEDAIFEEFRAGKITVLEANTRVQQLVDLYINTS